MNINDLIILSHRFHPKIVWNLAKIFFFKPKFGLSTQCGLTSLPGGLQVGGDLYVRGSFLKTKTKNEIKEMIYPGLKGKIYGGKK